MSITDELRKWVRYLDENPHLGSLTDSGKQGLRNIADRIDEQHESEVSAADRNGYVEAMGKVDSEYTKLPVDADGVPIHVGDYVETLIEAFKGERGRVECLTLTEDGWCVDGDRPSTVRHVQPDSWERIIEDAISECGWEQPKEYEIDFEDSKETRDRFVAELVERCKRLAGE